EEVMMFFERRSRNAMPRKARGARPRLESLEGRQVLSTAHPLSAAVHHAAVATTVEVAPLHAATVPIRASGAPISIGVPAGVRATVYHRSRSTRPRHRQTSCPGINTTP